jgi:crotonobetainyl-CoA:carnitine CoA-transferase CaiB-like acyl-CoA transferase
MMDQSLNGPLTGIRVVELSTMITAPLAGMMLGDLGADVIKVENPSGGDPYRSFRGGAYSPHFCAYNRNKRSVCIDLRSAEGRNSFLALIDTADVFIVNMRPGALDRLELGHALLQARNPRLVCCDINGFGPSGDYVDRPAYDAVAQALSGITSMAVEPGSARITGPTVADNATGLYAAYGILGALMERGRTGKGRLVEVNMLDSAIAFIPDPYGYYTALGQVSDPYLRARTSQSYVFRCADDGLLAVHLSSQDKFWRSFIAVTGLHALAEDTRFATRMDRIENYFALHEAAAPTFAARDRDGWVAALQGCDLPYAPVLNVAEVMEDPQVRHLGTFQTLTHPQEGALTAIRRPVWFDGSRADQPGLAPPRLGEHTDQVLGALAASRKPE